MPQEKKEDAFSSFFSSVLLLLPDFFFLRNLSGRETFLLLPLPPLHEGKRERERKS